MGGRGLWWYLNNMTMDLSHNSPYTSTVGFERRFYVETLSDTVLGLYGTELLFSLY